MRAAGWLLLCSVAAVGLVDLAAFHPVAALYGFALAFAGALAALLIL